VCGGKKFPQKIPLKKFLPLNSNSLRALMGVLVNGNMVPERYPINYLIK
jgi:hypothetical protein